MLEYAKIYSQLFVFYSGKDICDMKENVTMKVDHVEK